MIKVFGIDISCIIIVAKLIKLFPNWFFEIICIFTILSLTSQWDVYKIKHSWVGFCTLSLDLYKEACRDISTVAGNINRRCIIIIKLARDKNSALCLILWQAQGVSLLMADTHSGRKVYSAKYGCRSTTYTRLLSTVMNIIRICKYTN